MSYLLGGVCLVHLTIGFCHWVEGKILFFCCCCVGFVVFVVGVGFILFGDFDSFCG